uniref:Orf104a n=1 Tax=Batis maritima TaxID=4436 RepID=A0A068BBL0_BATMA|nr:orf104a [Batis maritima]AIC83315.1 orf104a [Batis maritima]
MQLPINANELFLLSACFVNCTPRLTPKFQYPPAKQVYRNANLFGETSRANTNSSCILFSNPTKSRGLLKVPRQARVPERSNKSNKVCIHSFIYTLNHPVFEASR